MSLRVRTGLLVLLAFAIVCVGFALASLKREELITAQFSGSLLVDRSTLWRQIVDNLVARMEDKAWVAAENAELAAAVASDDHETVQRLAAGVAELLGNDRIADRFDVVRGDGSLAYSSRSALLQSPIISPTAARNAAGERIRGVGNDRQRNVSVVLGVPLKGGGGAMGVYATDIGEAISALEQATQTSVLIVNRRGRLIAGSSNDLWEKLKGAEGLDAVDTLQTVSVDDRVYSAVVLPLTASLGSLVARLISIKDVTELARTQRDVSRITIGAGVAFLILVFLGLNFYMFRSFVPLTEGVDVLKSLSRGDLTARIEHAGGRDEVGRIAEAVNLFRVNLISFYSFRRSRERQRRRQERFIRKRLTQLADTLDEGERKVVLAELDELERVIGSAPAGGVDSIADASEGATTALRQEADSLARTAEAFRKMSDMVQDQNTRLRDALAAKNAFIALQKELDIASRVQLSLLPNVVPVSASYGISGVMQPAKEVGGDFYDFFALDGERTGVIVADVSGKGVPSALFMVMVRTVMQSTVRYLPDPGQVLESVNNFLVENNAEDLFVTVFYGVLDNRTGRFTYANGGHNSPVLLDRHGARTLELTGGIVLGMFPGMSYAEAHVDLEAGARVVLLTDGVTEAFNAETEAFGDDRLLDVVRALPEQDPEADVGNIVTAVHDFTGEAPQFDDITCVVLRFNGPKTAPGTELS